MTTGNTQHTPGPWEVSKHGVPDYVFQAEIYASDGRDLATVTSSAADAHLMAAAPELLAEAIELLKNAEYADGQAVVLTQDCEALQAAIAKARGVVGVDL